MTARPTGGTLVLTLLPAFRLTGSERATRGIIAHALWPRL